MDKKQLEEIYEELSDSEIKDLWVEIERKRAEKKAI